MYVNAPLRSEPLASAAQTELSRTYDGAGLLLRATQISQGLAICQSEIESPGR